MYLCEFKDNSRSHYYSESLEINLLQNADVKSILFYKYCTWHRPTLHILLLLFALRQNTFNSNLSEIFALRQYLI